jgi:hypothetical protein
MKVYVVTEVVSINKQHVHVDTNLYENYCDALEEYQEDVSRYLDINEDFCKWYDVKESNEGECKAIAGHDGDKTTFLVSLTKETIW